MQTMSEEQILWWGSIHYMDTVLEAILLRSARWGIFPFFGKTRPEDLAIEALYYGRLLQIAFSLPAPANNEPMRNWIERVNLLGATKTLQSRLWILGQ